VQTPDNSREIVDQRSELQGYDSWASKQCSKGGSMLDWRVLATERLLQSAYNRPSITLEDTGRVVGITGHYLGKLFHKQTGVTFHRYLKTLRMRRAGELLQNTGLTLERISAEVGYTDTSNFVRAFRSVFGMTPGEYGASFRIGPGSSIEPDGRPPTTLESL
jgi:AraC-like DNA-binding protein